MRLREGGEITGDDLTTFFQLISPVIEFVEFSGQRWKDRSKLSANGHATIVQRLYVLSNMIYPHILGSMTHVEMGRELDVSRSMIMRSVKDFNVAFGVFSPNQKRVSVHAPSLGEEGTYVEAARRGHETRRRRKAERETLEKQGV